MEIFGLNILQVVGLAALVLVLFIVLFVAKLFLRATKRLFRIGCLGVVAIALAAYVIIRAFGS